MPPNVDMNLIREALMRRVQGTQPQSTIPMLQQVSQPNTALPTGGPNVPIPQPTPMANAQPNQLPQQSSQSPAGAATPSQQMAKSAQVAAGLPDEDTRNTAKLLVSKLIKYL